MVKTIRRFVDGRNDIFTYIYVLTHGETHGYFTSYQQGKFACESRQTPYQIQQWLDCGDIREIADPEKVDDMAKYGDAW